MSQTRLVRVIAQSIVFHIDNYIYKKMSYTTKLILLNYGEVSHRHFQSKYIRKTLLDQQCLCYEHRGEEAPQGSGFRQLPIGLSLNSTVV